MLRKRSILLSFLNYMICGIGISRRTNLSHVLTFTRLPLVHCKRHFSTKYPICCCSEQEKLPFSSRCMVYSRFTEQDDETLLRLRDQEEQSWLEIAKRLNRNSSSCVSRYQMLKESEPVDLNFTPEEDRLLKELVTQGKSWKEIATILGKRYGHVCKRRYEDTLKNENKRGEFTEEEDKKLLSLVDKYGAKWNKIAEELKTRTAHQCLLRYERVLRPSLQRGPFNEKEDDRLLTLFDKYGPQWSKIEKEMPWRSSVQLRKRYCTLQEQKRRNKNAWAEEEEILLIQLFEKYGRKWTEISKELKTRTPSECMYRIYDYIEKGKLDRLIGWTEEYDKRLQEFVELYGEHWIYISRRMKYFSPRQCQQRWQIKRQQNDS